MSKAIIIAVILILICAWLFSSVRLEMSYQKNELASEGEIWLKYLFFKIRLVPGKEKKSDKENKDGEQKKNSADFDSYKRKISDILRIFGLIKDDILDILRYCTKRMIVIKKLSFGFEYGLDDPMYTGILNGIIYGAAYNIMSVIYHNANVEKFDIDIKPDFNRVCHSLKADCILYLKNVHITVIIVKALRLYFKLRKLSKERK